MAAHRLVRLLKVVLPLVVIVLIAIPAWNYWGRRPEPAPPENLARSLEEGLAVLSEGVTFSQSRAGKTQFTVTAKVNLGFEDNKQMLQDVEVIVFPENEGDPTRRIQSEQCSYDEQTGNIHFTGDVRFQLDDRTQGRSQELTYNHANRVISSAARVDIEQPGVARGAADQLEYFIDAGTLRLVGNIDIRVDTGSALRGGVAVFQQQENWVTISDGIHIESSNGWVRGTAGRADLEPGSYQVRRISIEGQVTGETRTGGSAETWTIQSGALQGVMSATGNIEKVAARNAVRLTKNEKNSAANSRQTLTAEEVDAVVSPNGQISDIDARQNAVLIGPETELRSNRIWLNASGGVATESESVLKVRESVIEGRQFSIVQGDVFTFTTPHRATVIAGPRRTAADRTDARFDGKTNQLIEIVQTGNFEFSEGARKGRADRAVVREGGDRVTLEGKATVSEPQMKMDAHEIRLNQKTGEFEADRDVTVSLAQSEPLLVKALQAKGNADRVVYTGNVQLWRGTAHIQAGTVDASTKNRNFRAQGNVRSQMDALRVSSETLDFEEASETAHYFGNVSARKRDKQGETRLDTADLSVRLEKGDIAEAVARGGVVMTQGARHGKGEEAIYDARLDQITLIGKNAEVNDPQRGLVRGTRLDVKSGGDIVVVQGEPGGRVTSIHKVQE